MFTPERNAAMRSVQFGSGPSSNSPTQRLSSSFGSSSQPPSFGLSQSSSYNLHKSSFSTPGREPPLSINDLRTPPTSNVSSYEHSQRPRYQLLNTQNEIPQSSTSYGSSSFDPHPIVTQNSSPQERAFLPSYLLNAAQGMSTSLKESTSPERLYYTPNTSTTWYGSHARQTTSSSVSPPSRFGGVGFAAHSGGKRRSSSSQMEMDEVPPAFSRAEIEEAEAAAAERELYDSLYENPIAKGNQQQSSRHISEKNNIMTFTPSRSELPIQQKNVSSTSTSSFVPRRNPAATPDDKSSFIQAHLQASPVMVFGYPANEEARQFIEQQFRAHTSKNDDIVNVNINEGDTTMTIIYANTWEAVKAVQKNGMQWTLPNGQKFFVGVKSLTPKVQDMAMKGTASVGTYGKILTVEKGGKASPKTKDPPQQPEKKMRAVSKLSMSASHSPLARQLTADSVRKRLDRQPSQSTSSGLKDNLGSVLDNDQSKDPKTQNGYLETAGNAAFNVLNAGMNAVFGW